MRKSARDFSTRTGNGPEGTTWRSPRDKIRVGKYVRTTSWSHKCHYTGLLWMKTRRVREPANDETPLNLTRPSSDRKRRIRCLFSSQTPAGARSLKLHPPRRRYANVFAFSRGVRPSPSRLSLWMLCIHASRVTAWNINRRQKPHIRSAMITSRAASWLQSISSSAGSVFTRERDERDENGVSSVCL